MEDHQTRRRQGELNAWQRSALLSILSDATRPGGEWASKAWRAVETAMAAAGIFFMGIVALWLIAALLGLYWDIMTGGFAFGRHAMAFLLGWWPR